MSDYYIIFKCDNKIQNIIIMILDVANKYNESLISGYKLINSVDGTYTNMCKYALNKCIGVFNYDGNESEIYKINDINEGFYNKIWRNELYLLTKTKINHYKKSDINTNDFYIFSEQIKYHFCYKGIITNLGSNIIEYNEVDLSNYHAVEINKSKIPSFMYKISYILAGYSPKKNVYDYDNKSKKHIYSDVLWNEYYDFNEEKNKYYEFYDIYSNYKNHLLKNKKYDLKICFF